MLRHFPWLVALFLSVLLHAGVLLVPGWSRLAAVPDGRKANLTFRMHVQQPVSSAMVAAPEHDAPRKPAAAEQQAPTQVQAIEPALASKIGDATDGDHYFTPDELTEKPVFLRDDGAPTPKFIPDVMPLPVLAQVFIDEQGRVIDVVLSESFLSDIAKQFITASFFAMQFSPGRLGSLPVKSRLSIEVKLDPALSAN